MLVYHDEVGVTDAFLLCAGRIVCQGKICSAYQVIMMLMASYFVMDRKYPQPYRLFLWFVHVEVLHMPVEAFTRTVNFNRFKKDYHASP